MTEKQLHDLRSAMDIQGADGNWDADDYMLGMFNGMELMMAVVESREPAFRRCRRLEEAHEPA